MGFCEPCETGELGPLASVSGLPPLVACALLGVLLSPCRGFDSRRRPPEKTSRLKEGLGSCFSRTPHSSAWLSPQSLSRLKSEERASPNSLAARPL